MNNRLRTSEEIDLPEEKKSAYTINDIARELGYSKTTISRAISGKGRIGPKTREIVTKWITDHGYAPNPLARGLAESRTLNIGITLPEDASGGDIPFFQNCLVSMTAACTAKSYDVILIVVSGKNISELKRIVQARKVDGIVLMRLLVEDEAVAFLKQARMPFVVIGSTPDEAIYQVDSRQKDACRELIGKLLADGCKRIALLAGDPAHMVSRMRYEGYAEAVAAAAGSVDDQLVFWNARQSLDRIITELVEAQIDCIACMDDIICTETVGLLRQHRVNVPHEVKVVSFYDSTALENCNPAITALHVDDREVSNLAVNKLICLLKKQPCEQKTLVDCSIKYRESSR